MRRFMVVGRKKSVWFLLGAVVYVFIILLGLGNMVVSLVSITEKELPIYSVQREEALVALTFNCAWEENDIPQLLDLLERENIKATFFLVGQWIERYPDSVPQIVDAGKLHQCPRRRVLAGRGSIAHCRRARVRV